MSRKSNTKQYYSIADVSNITNLKPHVLRFWESKFPQLKPKKNKGGNRIYQIDDIRFINLIKQLLYKEKYTIAGALEKLKELNEMDSDSGEDILWEAKKDILESVRKELREIISDLT
jgi:DNA-binding transcriptional MerR regulator